ncbi:MAG: hypothetical protein QM612_07735 [Thermomonas sp.]|uniref:hypothetical protein n=1 Tax=Thermomonas sp. TaxID=1971895 RepID=UPI0039E5A46D
MTSKKHMPFAQCPHCKCACADDNGAHALLAALREDDLDAALSLGLLEAQPCPGCDADCNAGLIEARDARRFALAARDRYRARAARLARIKAERDAARRPAVAATLQSAPALPSAAASALARALAKAKERRK